MFNRESTKEMEGKQMEQYTASGETVEKAIETGLNKLGITRNDASITIISEGKKGIFGFGKKDAIVEITSTLESKNQVEQEILLEEKVFNEENSLKEVLLNERNDDVAIDISKKYLVDILTQIGADATVEEERVNDKIIFHVKTEKPGLVIGKHGKVLNALQALTQVLVHRHAKSKLTAIVNVGDYRERRETILKQLAERTAEKVLRTNQPVFLEPMPAFERKQIHFYLSKDGQVTTHSEGNEPHRYLVVEPVKKRF